MSNSFYGIDEPRTSLASPSESRVVATRAQPDVGFAAPWRLAFSAMLRADFVDELRKCEPCRALALSHPNAERLKLCYTMAPPGPDYACG